MFLVLIQWSSSFKALSSLRSRKWNIVKENIHCRLDKAVYLGSMHFAKRKPYSDALLDTLWCCVVVSAQIYLQLCVNCTDCWWVASDEWSLCVLLKLSAVSWSVARTGETEELRTHLLLSHHQLFSLTEACKVIHILIRNYFSFSQKSFFLNQNWYENSPQNFPKKDSYYD